MTEYIALALAGGVSPLLTQAVKKVLQWSDFKALALAAVTAWLVAILAMWATGELHSPQEVVLKVNAVFGLATLIYKVFATAQTET